MVAVVDHRIPHQAQTNLTGLGYTLCKLPSHPALATPVSAHPDMLLFFAPDQIFCTKEYYQIAKKELDSLSEHCKKRIDLINDTQTNEYPHDILLNAAPVGKDLFCYADHTASELTQHPAYRIQNVRQGYAKCSVIPIGDNALITADPSIAKQAQAIGKEVLNIQSGHVHLDGYNTGFIGGCTSYSPYQSSKCIFFCGNFNHHPDASRISSFCYKHGYQPQSLGEFSLYDIGTIFLL